MLNIALKEWSIVCDLLTEGSLAILLRKGGIHEEQGAGEFCLEHARFALYPSWAHQKPEMIKPPWRSGVRVMDEPAEITFTAIGRATGIWQVPDRQAFDQLDDLHCWTRPQIDMRFNYKPDHPLYLVAIRCHRLARSRTIQNDWSYGGCKSWVTLRPADVVDDSETEPVIDDDAFARLLDRLDHTMSRTAAP